MSPKAPSPKDIVDVAEPEPWIKPLINIRARYEYGDQEGRDDSHAGTLRARLGLVTKKLMGFQVLAEYEGTLAVDRDSYQAASVHGLGQNKTIIADPESHELNQLWISHDLFGHGLIKPGRQNIVLDNARYVGDVAWRQNSQTFDAATLTIDSIPDVKIQYGYINKVNRIFGSGDIRNPAQTDFEGDSHYIHTTYEGLPFGTLKAFGYFFDLTNDAGSAASNQSFGASLAGPLPLFQDSGPDMAYYLEYGYQEDAFNSPLEYGAHYFHANVSAKSAPHSFVLGYEYLGSDNGVGYKFPLATLHKFNGFADVFLNTPGDGLQNPYIMAGTKLPWDIDLKVFYHSFWTAEGGDHLGHEVDVVLAKKLGKGVSALAKLGHFMSEDSSYPDLTRFSVQLDYKF